MKGWKGWRHGEEVENEGGEGVKRKGRKREGGKEREERKGKERKGEEIEKGGEKGEVERKKGC